MKKTRIIRWSIVLFIIVLTMSTTSMATIDEATKVYKEWENLSQQEKQNSIIPKVYTVPIESSVKKSVLNKINQGIGDTNLPTSYHLKDTININVKDQGNTNECWAFATNTILETNIAKRRNKILNFSARHMDYATSRVFADGINEKGYNREIGFGNYMIALDYYTSGRGPVLESDMPFEDNTNKISLSEINKKVATKIKDYTEFADIYKIIVNGNITYTDAGSKTYTKTQVEGIRNIIKNQIMNYGAVTAFTYMNPSDLSEYTNLEKVQQGTASQIAYFNNNNQTTVNHAITIVGWDDNYSKENFNDNRKPTEDGAYIILNSSNANQDLLKYMYVSYEDIWIEYANYGIIETSEIDYDNMYQYDEYGYSYPLEIEKDDEQDTTESAYIANVFDRVDKTTQKEEYIKEVSIYIPYTTNVDVYINAQNDDKTKLEKVAAAGTLNPGYHTVQLATPIKLTGERFVIAAKLTADKVVIGTEMNYLSNGGLTNAWDYATSKEGESFISFDSNEWIDFTNITLGDQKLKDTNACLKAFTIYQEKENIAVQSITLDKKTAEMKKGESLTLVAKINPDDATNKNVKWTSSDETVATVSKNGIITAIKDGITTITVTTEDGNKTDTCTITVKNEIASEDKVYYENNSLKGTSTNVEGTTDKTIATGTIPQTGVSKIIIITIIAIAGIGVVIYIKIKKMKDIK